MTVISNFLDSEKPDHVLLMDLQQAQEAIRQPEWRVLAAPGVEMAIFNSTEDDSRMMVITRFAPDDWIITTGTTLRRKYLGPFFPKRITAILNCTSVEEVDEHLAYFYTVSSNDYTALIKQQDEENTHKLLSAEMQ